MNPSKPIINEENDEQPAVSDLELSDDSAQEVQAGSAYPTTFRGGVDVAIGDLN